MRRTRYTAVQCEMTDGILREWLEKHPALNRGEGVMKNELLDEFEKHCESIQHECTVWGVEDFMRRARRFGLVKVGKSKPKLNRFC